MKCFIHTQESYNLCCAKVEMTYVQEDLNAVQVEVRHFDIALTEVAPSNPGPNPEFFTKYNRGLFSGNSRGV